MKFILKLIFSNSKLIRNCWSLFNKFRYRKTNQFIKQECIRRKSLSLFDYHELSKKLESGYFHPSGDLRLYGVVYILSSYLGKKSISNSLVGEHGFIFSSFVNNFLSYQKKIITFSDYRENHILKHTQKKSVIKIGPYIHYAKSLLKENEYAKIKIYIGKTLVVFPFHSIDGVISVFNTDEFIELINQKSKNYDTVLVCLYWKDIQLNRAQQYLDKGYMVTTAGHSNDLFFLNRLRSIIELSDSIISNELGTYIGYCCYLRKPLQLIRQKTIFDEEKDCKEHLNLIGLNRAKLHWDEYETLQDILFRILGDDTLSEEGYEYISDLFGFNHIKSAEELKELVKK